MPRKAKIRQDFADALATDKLTEQRKLLDQKKAELAASNESLTNAVNETKLLASSLVHKLRADANRIKLILGASLNENYDKGMLFMSYKGDIIFVNKIALDHFKLPQASIVGAKVTRIIADGIEQPVRECSANLMTRVSACHGDVPCELYETMQACFGLKTDDKIALKLGNGTTIGPFTGTISLLDREPKDITDITYLLYININI